MQTMLRSLLVRVAARPSHPFARTQSTRSSKRNRSQPTIINGTRKQQPLSSPSRTGILLAAIAATGGVLAGYYGFATYSRLSSSGSRSSSPISILDADRIPTTKYASLDQMEKAVDEIRQELSGTQEDIISTDSEDLLAHGFSEWSSSLTTDDTLSLPLPVAVAYPRTTEQVSAIARICHKWKVPIIPYSGGSSLEDHTSAPFGGVSIDFAFMDKIVKFNEQDMDVVVQPGLCWTDLNSELALMNSGLFFPIDPAPVAKIGGMIGTNCSGTNAVRYGTMRDWVINVTVVLADGSVIKTRRRPRKCSAGYNLNGIIVGSEGTLGIVTEATLKLAAVPQHFSVAVVPFPDIRSAVTAASQVIRNGVPVAALELMDETQMRMINNSGVTKSSRVWEENPTLFFKFSGTRGTVDDNIKSVQQVIKPYQHQSSVFEFAKDEQEQELLWSARKESLYSLLAMRQEGEVMWNTDVAVPLSRLADIVEASKTEAAALGLEACVKGHVGDSNFHENITYDGTDPEQIARAKLAVENMVKRALEMEGTCTGEHGVGVGKKEALATEVGCDTITVMKLLKGTLDPYWIMNPGKVFDR